MSTFVQKHQVHSGKNCAQGYDSLPVGSMVLPLGEIQGWRTVGSPPDDDEMLVANGELSQPPMPDALTEGNLCIGKSTAASLTAGNIAATDSKSNEERVENKMDQVNLGSDSEQELPSGNEKPGRKIGENSVAGVQRDDDGFSQISDKELERKLSTLSRRQLAWRAGVGKFGDMTHAELVALVTTRYRASPFDLPGDDD